MAGIVSGYGVALIGASLLLRWEAPEVSAAGFAAGVAGGVLSLGFGLAGLAGYQRRSWAVLSLSLAGLVVLTETVHVWMMPAGEASGRLTGGAILTVMLASIVGMLMYLLHGERTAEFYEVGHRVRTPAADASRRQEETRKSEGVPDEPNRRRALAQQANSRSRP